MRILMVNTARTRRNGITNVIFNLYRAMDNSGTTVDLLAIEEPEAIYVDEIERGGGRVIVVPRSIKHALRYIHQLKNVIESGRYDIVHVHGSSHAIAIDLLAAKMAKCKNRIAHSHNTTCNSVAMHKMLSPLFYSCCTERLACGSDAGRWMYGDKAFSVINNGVNTARFSFDPSRRADIRSKYDVEGKTVIGHVGGFVETKNQTFLIDVLRELNNMNDRYCLMLVGDGALKKHVYEKVISMGLEESVIFVGLADAVEDYLSAMDCIVMPSIHEGLPLSLVEQQTNGLDCIVSENITKEVNLTGNVSFVSLSESPKSWAERIISVEEKKDWQSVQLRVQKSKEAVEQIKTKGYDIQEEAEKLLMLYRKLAGDRCNEG